MADLNKVLLIGRITSDLEVKKMGDSGTSVINFTLATNRVYKKQDGTKIEEAEFTRCVAFWPLADMMWQYLSKGRKVYIEWRLRTRQWEDQAWNKRYTTEVVVTDMNFCDSKASWNTENTNPAPVDNSTTEEEDIPF